MRKHFLLLFLMAILPFTAWAANLVEIGATLVAPSYVYGEGHTVKVVFQAVTLNLDDDPGTIELVGYYNNEDCAEEHEVDDIANAGQGTYWVKVKGVNDYEGELKASFIISPRPVKLKFSDIEVGFGYQADQLYVDDETIILAMNEGASTKVQFKDYDEDVYAALTQEQIEAMNLVVGRETPTTFDAGFYNFVKVSSSSNYDVSIDTTTPTQFHIAGIQMNTFDDGDFVLTGGDATKAYTGEAMERNVEYDGDVQGVTFTVAWKDAENNVVTELVNAGSYKAVLTGTGNYEGEKVLDNFFQITRKSLTIYVNPKDEAYTATSYVAANVEYTIGGLVNKDQGKVDRSTLVPSVQKKDGDLWVDAEFPVKNVGTYKVSVNAGNAKIQTGVNENEDPIYGNLSANYEVATTASEWTISKAALTLTAASQEIEFGEDVPNSTVTATVAVAAEKALIEDAFKAPAVGADNQSYGTQPNIYTPTRKVAEDYEGTEVEVAEALAAANALLANYVDEPTLVTGSLSVGSGSFTIMPVIASRQYDATPLAATSYYAYNGNYTLTTDDIDVNTISYRYLNVTPGVTGAQWTTEAPAEVGTYRVVVYGGENVEDGVAGKGSFLNAVPQCDEVEFNILPKELTITITGATLHIGDTEETLAAHTEFSEYTTVNGQKIEFKPVFAYDNEVLVAVGLTIDPVTGKISYTTTADEFNGANAITAEMVAGDNFNDNYHVTFIPGNLAILASSLTLDPEDENLAAKIAEAALTGQNYDVDFDNFTLEANKWYTMVLPYATSALNLVKQFDTYVVINTLANSSVKEGIVTVNFGLNMGNLDAGTPFLIKAGEDIDLSTIGAINTLIVSDITAGASDKATFEATYESGKSIRWGYDLDGNIDEGFVYVDAQNTDWASATNKYRYLNVGEQKWKNIKNSSHALVPMEAFLKLNDPTATGARVFVEDIENGTTAIKELGVDGTNKAYSVDGWYTVDGIKLQSTPTEKGIYINNGKKVVVK